MLVSTVSGSSPCRPSSTAFGLPWPCPVAPSEPYSSTCSRCTAVRSPDSTSASANIRAARIGPTVWELDGPIPMEKRSKTLMVTGGLHDQLNGRRPA